MANKTRETAETIKTSDPSEIITERKIPTMKMRLTAAIIMAFIIGLSFFAVHSFTTKEERRLEQDLSQRIELMVIERSTILSTWLNSLTGQSRPLAQSEILRGFATALDQVEGNIQEILVPKEGAIVDENGVGYEDRIPFMINAMTDLVRDTNFLASYALDRRGKTFLTSIDAPPLLSSQKEEALKIFDTKEVSFGDFYIGSQGLELDIYSPIFQAQTSGSADEVVGVFILKTLMADDLDVLLRPNPISGLSGAYHLFQRNFNGEVERIDPQSTGNIEDSKLSNEILSRGVLEFSGRDSFSGERKVYSYGNLLTGTDFFLAWETGYEDARMNLAQLKLNAYLIAIFFIVAFVAAAVAFWWRFNSDRNEMLAQQYGQFASQISHQKNLLDSINNTIKEFISVKDKKGKYSYVNPSFASAVGRNVDDLIGLDDESVFGHGTAERLRKLDEMARKSGQPVSVIDEIYLKGKKKNLQISKVPIALEDSEGIVTVARDISELVAEQEKREKSIKQTVAGLVKAVEMRDPHLAGHSRRVADFAVAIAHDISTDPKLQRTVEIGASLCQIGKLDVPEDLLRADRRLNEEELKVVQQHIVSAEKIISEIDFDVPVAKAVGQMYERLDGSGYPQNLKEDDICLEARILGICDYFCARIESRSYRQGISPEEALHYLEQNAQKYDPTIVRALKDIVSSSQGEKIIASI